MTVSPKACEVKPEPGKVYEVAVHGEPPEGREVLWGLASSAAFTGGRYDHQTHWMLAPTPAPEPPAPQPFPLSREEWDGETREIRARMAPLRELYQWWLDFDFGVFGECWDYETVVAAWHAAGCPGSTQAEGTEEGPWRLREEGPLDHLSLIDREGCHAVSVRPVAASGGSPEHVLGRLISDANDKATAEAEAERLRGELEATADALEDVRREIPAQHRVGAYLVDGIRSLVARAEEAEAERQKLWLEVYRVLHSPAMRLTPTEQDAAVGIREGG